MSCQGRSCCFISRATWRGGRCWPIEERHRKLRRSSSRASTRSRFLAAIRLRHSDGAAQDAQRYLVRRLVSHCSSALDSFRSCNGSASVDSVLLKRKWGGLFDGHAPSQETDEE